MVQSLASTEVRRRTHEFSNVSDHSTHCWAHIAKAANSFTFKLQEKFWACAARVPYVVSSESHNRSKFGPGSMRSPSSTTKRLQCTMHRVTECITQKSGTPDTRWMAPRGERKGPTNTAHRTFLNRCPCSLPTCTWHKLL